MLYLLLKTCCRNSTSQKRSKPYTLIIAKSNINLLIHRFQHQSPNNVKPIKPEPVVEPKPGSAIPYKSLSIGVPKGV